MRTVKLSRPLFHVDRHYVEGQTLILPDEVANMVVKDGGGDYSETTDPANVANADANRLHDAVDPLVPDADPLHAARALGLKVDEHPGLVAMKHKIVDDPGIAKTGRVRTDQAVDTRIKERTDAPAADQAKPVVVETPVVIKK